MIKELSMLQDKLRHIDSLSNCIQSENITRQDANDIAYLMYKIIQCEGYVNSDLARQVLSYQLKANGDLFVNI